MAKKVRSGCLTDTYIFILFISEFLDEGVALFVFHGTLV